MFSRRNILLTTPALLLLPACATKPGSDPVQSLYQQAIAAQKAAAVLFQGGAALVATKVIAVPSAVYDDVDASFSGLTDSLDSVNKAIQAGTTSGVDVLLSAAMTALGAAQAALRKLQATPSQASALMVAHPMTARASANDIIGLIIQFLPLVLSIGGPIASLIQSLIADLQSPANGVTLTLADVEAANTDLHRGLLAWTSAAPL